MSIFRTNQTGRSQRFLRPGMYAAAVIVFAAPTLAACGGQDSGSGNGSGGSNALSVSVVDPANGANVNLPFSVKVKSSVPLGPTSSGEHHVHIWFDDDQNDYLVVESDQVQVTSTDSDWFSHNAPNLSPGQHTMHVSLRNANHSPAGAETQTTVMIGDAGAPAGSTPATTPTSDGGGGYGY